MLKKIDIYRVKKIKRKYSCHIFNVVNDNKILYNDIIMPLVTCPLAMGEMGSISF